MTRKSASGSSWNSRVAVETRSNSLEQVDDRLSIHEFDAPQVMPGPMAAPHRRHEACVPSRPVQLRPNAFVLVPALNFGCGRLAELRVEPPVTPEQWCELRPCVFFGDFVFNEPLGSLLVFALAALWIVAGVRFLRDARGQQSRRWFGVALVLGGGGAALAGISYQAFSYMLKCAGEAHCRLTNGFEVGYSVLQALSVSAMLLAIAYACVHGRPRRLIVAYAAINAIAYALVSAAGVMLPSRSLLSFEVLSLFALPPAVLVIALAAKSLTTSARALDRSLLISAVFLLLVQAAHFAYAAAGLTERLWRNGRGFYFSANDVLHAGMIAWLVWVVAALGPELRDRDGIGREGEEA